MAVLHWRAGAHGGVRGIRPGADLRLSGRRCRLRAFRDGALYREHRNHTGALSRGVQEQLLRRRLAQSVAGADATRTGGGAYEAGRQGDGRLAQGEVSGGAGITLKIDGRDSRKRRQFSSGPDRPRLWRYVSHFSQTVSGKLKKIMLCEQELRG